jgi:SAM-dependent methyltransferase
VRPAGRAATISWLIGERPAGSRVLDLGAGTGKGTRTLLELGMRTTALDPSDGMLAALRANAPEATVLEGNAEAIPLAGAAVDAVIALQAWHWFDSLAAGRECARVLAPGGTLGVAWHVRDERVPWVYELSQSAGRHEDSSADLRGMAAPEVGDDFGPPERAVFEYELSLSVDELVQLASSWSYLALASDREERLETIRGVGERAADHGVVRIPHRTVCYRYLRR